MSKFEVAQSESFTITKKGDSSIYVSLTRAEAKELWFALGNKLNLNPEVKWQIGSVIPSNSREPDLPIGSVIEDDSAYKDRAVKVEDGWQWKTMLGSPSDTPFQWQHWNEQSWVVVEVGGP